MKKKKKLKTADLDTGKTSEKNIEVKVNKFFNQHLKNPNNLCSNS